MYLFVGLRFVKASLKMSKYFSEVIGLVYLAGQTIAIILKWLSIAKVVSAHLSIQRHKGKA